MTSAPACSQRAAISTLLDSWIWPCRSGSPGATSSSPVTTTATRGARWQLSSATPPVAIAASASGRRRLPAETTTECAATSVPWRRTWSPWATGPSKTTRSPVAVARSMGTIASAPGGSGAPVAIVIAVCGARRTGSSPANDWPVTGQVGARVLGADGVAVHRGVVEGRQVVRRAHVGGDGAARERARQRERLGRQRDEPREQERSRLVGQQRAGVGDGHGPML